MRWIILAVLVLMAPVARADQSDPRLPALFERLRAAAPDQAGDLREQIWSIWFESREPEIDALMREGDEAVNSGRETMAIAIYDAVLERRPDFAEAWNRRATTYFLLGAYDRSEADIARVLALEPRHFGALSGLGLIALARQRDQAALRAFERALAIDPNLPGARINVEMLGGRAR